MPSTTTNIKQRANIARKLTEAVTDTLCPSYLERLEIESVSALPKREKSHKFRFVETSMWK